MIARQGAVGTLSSVDLRRHHEDLMARTHKSDDKALIDAANLEALDREVCAALALADGHGMVAVNVMRAVSEYAHYVEQACRSGAQAIVVGAGLPLDLPDLVADHPDVALIPILSDARGIAVLIRKWMRKNRLPDAIVIEHPRHAGGHLGAAKIADLNDPRFDFENVLPETLKLFEQLGIEPIPLICAGGISTPERVRELISLGASGVQLGTPFAVTVEGDAHINFKKVLAEAKPEDIVEFMSNAGLPARAVRTPWLDQYLKKLSIHEARAKIRKCTFAFDCLETCGFRDGISKIGQFCIDQRLSFAVKGDVRHGLFFRGAGKLPFGTEIRPVRDLLAFLLGTAPAPEAGA
jgi:nitronate monooxygenase